ASKGSPLLSIPFRLLIPHRLYDRMLAQAIAELPNECCGVLAGRPSTQEPSLASYGRSATEYYPLKNAAASPVEYLSEPKSMFEAVRDMRQRGLEIVAIYHSHPSSAPIPSRTDLARNYSEDVMNLIISLESRNPLLRGWWLKAGTFE